MLDTDEVIEHQEADTKVEVSEVLETMNEDHSSIGDESTQDSQQKTVPLEVLKKERKKRQEAEMNAAYQQQQLLAMQQAKEPEDDSYKYESVTREESLKSQQETIRIIEEKMWIKANPEKYEQLNEYLPELLKQRPHLAKAIDGSPNRYDEAYTLMTALSPRQQSQLKQAPKKVAPNSPSGVPKGAAIGMAVDVMSMNDSEFNEWRKSKKRR
jgi:hypothetical protein